MIFRLTILGCGSATPTLDRNPTAQILNVSERFFLIDCGEGTQMQLRRHKIGFRKINHILISHLHGDHYLGLMGLLSSMHLNRRNVPLHIYAVKELEEIIRIQLKHSDSHLCYELVFHAIDPSSNTEVFRDDYVSISTIPMLHRIPCCGFLFTELPRQRNIRPEKIEQYQIEYALIPRIKAGADYTTSSGKKISNSELTTDPPKPRSYAYCSDTIYDESIIPIIHKTDLLYHESTFLEALRERATETLHCTTKDAARIAEKAEVRKLIIGHFSSRYTNTDELLKEAKSVFNNSIAAFDGLVVDI